MNRGLKTSGFTLIELLVVIAIIGILSSVVLSSLNSARAKARDAKRLSDMHQMQVALELYHNSFGVYPYSDFAGCGGWDSSGTPLVAPSFTTALVSNGFLAANLIDPTINNDCGNYAYYRYDAQGNCLKPFYVLGVRDMETSANPYSSSPGWSCTGTGARNWQGEFDWVTGKFDE